MELLLFVLVLVGLAAGGVWMSKRLDTSKAVDTDAAPPKMSTRSNPFATTESDGFWRLAPGDLIQFEGNDFFVRRSIVCNDSGYEWREHRLDNSLGRKHWLSVEDDEGIDLGIWKELPLADVQEGRAGDVLVKADGKAFKLKESGRAQWSSDGASGQVEYFQYEAADGSMLAFQRYDMATNWEASLGTRHRPSEFDIFPSSPTN